MYRYTFTLPMPVTHAKCVVDPVLKFTVEAENYTEALEVFQEVVTENMGWHPAYLRHVQVETYNA